jgi:hypothetical protein
MLPSNGRINNAGRRMIAEEATRLKRKKQSRRFMGDGAGAAALLF